MQWPVASVHADIYTYTWNTQNYMTAATHTVDGAVADRAFFDRGNGWQVNSVTINDAETRHFSYGYGGEVLTETVPNFGTRTYVNSSIDHAEWSIESAGTNPLKFWLRDINGTVYGAANDQGTILERQSMDAFGTVKITDPVTGLARPSAIGNRSGLHGHLHLPELGIDWHRNRCYDPVTGRYLSRDPLGKVDGPNVYGFCGGDPTNRTDPMGTKWHKRKGKLYWQNDGDGPIPDPNADIIDEDAIAKRQRYQFNFTLPQINLIPTGMNFGAFNFRGMGSALKAMRASIASISGDDSLQENISIGVRNVSPECFRMSR